MPTNITPSAFIQEIYQYYKQLVKYPFGYYKNLSFQERRPAPSVTITNKSSNTVAQISFTVL